VHPRAKKILVVSKLDRLYDEVVKRHNSQPYHFEKRPEATASIRAYNPICGDRFDLFLETEDDKIKQIHFHGFGCAVSKASTSVLAMTVEGKSIEEARAICNQFLRLLRNEIQEAETLASEEFKSFAIVREVPSRFDCAALAWLELEKFLPKVRL
jgi:nitrogen fixation protein NifU and related proteins